jgi:lipoprotein-releasing system ATP-binding protein
MLANDPAVILADEPTGNLDRTTAARVGELLLELQRQEQTMLIVVTHNPQLADTMGRRMELDDGTLKALPCPRSA